MTSELLTEAPAEEPEPVAPSSWPAHADTAARNHAYLSLAFLAVALLALVGAATQLVLPEALAGVEFVTYGRLWPVALNLFMFGWLTLGLLGAMYWMLPRVTGRPLQFAPLANLSGFVIAVGVVAGCAAVALGANEGRQYLELPLWADGIIALGVLGAIRAVTATITANGSRPLGPVSWYFGAAPIWLLLTLAVGNVPGVIGANATLQTAFFRGALFGLWFAAAAIGAVYYLVADATGESPNRSTPLSALGFWSLGFVWALTGASTLTYSIAPDWFETLGVVFAIALFLPAVVVFADIVGAVKGRLGDVAEPTVVRFVLAGAAWFGLVPIINLVQALRASGGIVGRTDWATGVDAAALLGAFSFWLVAALYHVVPKFRDGFHSRIGGWHLALAFLGLAVAVGAMLVGGLQAGLTWLGAANAGEVAAGSAFRSSVAGAEGVLWVRLVGLSLYAAAQLWFVANLGWHALSTEPAETTPVPDPEPGQAEASPSIGLAKLRVGTLGLFALAAVFGFALPAAEADHLTNTITADEARFYDYDDTIRQGRELYLAEGCWYCHTQEVRQIVTDVGLGAVTVAGDFAWEVPETRGVQRIGPDLFHVGAREETATTDFIVSHLADPRSERSWSTMPAYGHLTDAEMQSLAAYLTNLE